MRVRNVLVTGGAGFIGSNFVRHLLANHAAIRITNLDLLTYAGSPMNLNDLSDSSRHTLIQGDIADRELVERLLREHDVDTVVNFAAETHVDRSIQDPASFIHTNVLGTLALLEAVRTVWLVEGGRTAEDARFHHASTDEVYGSLEAREPPFLEGAAYRPSSPYAASKAAADHLVWAYHRTYDLPITITNCTNNYGPCQYPEKFIPLMILNVLEGRPLPIYGDGKQRRDWLHVEDHARAIAMVLERGTAGRLYHVSGRVDRTNLQVVEALCDCLERRLPAAVHLPLQERIVSVTDRPGHDRRYGLDSRRIERELGWSPRMDFHRGLEETVAWYVEHPSWVAHIRARPDYQAWLDRNYAQRGICA